MLADRGFVGGLGWTTFVVEGEPDPPPRGEVRNPEAAVVAERDLLGVDQGFRQGEQPGWPGGLVGPDPDGLVGGRCCQPPAVGRDPQFRDSAAMAAKHPEHPAVPAVEFLDASVFPAANDPVAGLVEYQCRCDPERVRLGLLRPEVDGQGPCGGSRIPVGVVHQHTVTDGMNIAVWTCTGSGCGSHRACGSGP